MKNEVRDVVDGRLYYRKINSKNYKLLCLLINI